MTIFSINGTNLFPIKVLKGNFIPLTVDFTGVSNEERIDLTIPQSGGLFGTLKTIFIDNSTNPNEVVVNVSGTNQTFVAPPYSDGFYPVAATGSSVITMTSIGGATAFNNVQMYDYETVPIVWLTEPAGSGAPITAPDGAIVTLGSKADVAVTNPALAGSLIALTKGILTKITTGIAGTAVTIANGGDVALGSTTDAAVTNPATNGTLISFIRGILTGVNSTVTGITSVVAALVTSNTNTGNTATSTAATAASAVTIVTNTGVIETNTNAFSLNNITTNTTTVVKNAPGTFGGLVVNSAGGAGSIIVYNNTASGGAIIGTYSSLIAGSFLFGQGVLATVGITVVTTGAPDVTILYK